MKGFIFIHSIFLSSVFCVVLFQRRIIYSCGGDINKTFLPASAFLLPEPSINLFGTHSFERRESDTELFFFHGNGVSVRDMYWHLGRLYGVCNCTIHAIESLTCVSKTCGLLGCSQDSVALYAALTVDTLLKPDKTNILMGMSLGTAHAISAAMYLNRDASISGLILENPFTSIFDLVPLPLSWLLFDTWSNENALSFVSLPLLILTSEEDEIVPSHMSTTLLNSYKGKKQQVILTGSLHGHAGAHPDYLPAMKTWLALNK